MKRHTIITLAGMMGRILSRMLRWRRDDVCLTDATHPVSRRIKYTTEPLLDYDHPLIVLDTSVILYVIGYKQITDEQHMRTRARTIAFLEKNKERIAVPETAQSEANLVLFYRGGTSAMYKKMEFFEGMTVTGYERALEKAEKIHTDACDEINTDTSMQWLHIKAISLRWEFGLSFDPLTAKIHERRKWLKKLYDEAASDRKIIAQALVLAEKENVMLLSNDGDITAFDGEFQRFATHRIQAGHCSRIPDQ